MIRYMFALSFWLVVAIALIAGHATLSGPDFTTDHFTVFGFGDLRPELFWALVALAFAVAIGFALAWWRSRPMAPTLAAA